MDKQFIVSSKIEIQTWLLILDNQLKNDFTIIEHQPTLVSLPTYVWNLIFLSFNDVLNLCYSHRKFRYMID